MNIDIISFKKIYKGGLLASVSVRLGDFLTINEIKILQTKQGLTTALPVEKFRIHSQVFMIPAVEIINSELQTQIETAVLNEFAKH